MSTVFSVFPFYHNRELGGEGKYLYAAITFENLSRILRLEPASQPQIYEPSRKSLSE